MGIDTFKTVFSEVKGPFSVHITGHGHTPVRKTSLNQAQAEFWFAAANPGRGYTAKLLNGSCTVKEKSA